MVQNIPPHAIYGVQNGQEIISENYRYNAPLKRMAQPLQQDTFTPQFTGAEDEAPKKKGVFGKLLTLAAAVGGAVLLKKNWNKVSQYVDDIIKKFKKGGTKTQTKAQQTIQNNANKVQTPKKAPRKHRLEHTVPNRNPKPISNAREAEVIENINLSHTNANTRKFVEKAGTGTVTPAQQKAYEKSIAYQAPTATQKTAMAERHAANAAQRAELNSIANNSTGAEKLVAAKTAAKAEAKAAQAITDGAVRHANGNIYHVKDGVITKVELFQRNKAGELVKNSVELTDAAKISKHLAKQGVIMHDLIAKGSVKVAA